LNAIDCAKNAHPSRENRTAALRKAEMNRAIRRGISCEVPVFPPAPPVTVAVDGRRLPEYARAYVVRGRVYAPAVALVRFVADRAWLEGSYLIVERGRRRVRLPFGSGFGEPPAAYVEAGPLLRALGESVRYSAGTRVLDVRTPAAGPVVTPSPFNAANAGQPPRAVFTPEPVPTRRPVWTGSPLPRRTPLPLPPRRPARRSR
jgi:hypothetical protein